MLNSSLSSALLSAANWKPSPERSGLKKSTVGTFGLLVLASITPRYGDTETNEVSLSAAGFLFTHVL